MEDEQKREPSLGSILSQAGNIATLVFKNRGHIYDFLLGNVEEFNWCVQTWGEEARSSVHGCQNCGDPSTPVGSQRRRPARKNGLGNSRINGSHSASSGKSSTSSSETDLPSTHRSLKGALFSTAANMMKTSMLLCYLFMQKACIWLSEKVADCMRPFLRVVEGWAQKLFVITVFVVLVARNLFRKAMRVSVQMWKQWGAFVCCYGAVPLNLMKAICRVNCWFLHMAMSALDSAVYLMTLVFLQQHAASERSPYKIIKQRKNPKEKVHSQITKVQFFTARSPPGADISPPGALAE